MIRAMLHLRMVDWKPPPETALQRVRREVRSASRKDDIVECPHCGSREVLTAIFGVRRNKQGKLSGGTDMIYCAPCLLGGRRVLLA